MTLPAACWIEPLMAAWMSLALCLAAALTIRLAVGPLGWHEALQDGEGKVNLSKGIALAFSLAALYGFFFLLLVGALTLELMLGLSAIAGVGQAARIASKWVSGRMPSSPAAAPADPAP